MHRLASLLAVLVLLAPGASRAQEPAAGGEPPAEGASGQPGFASALERTSYAVGYSFGNSLHHGGVELAAEQVAAGLLDGLGGAEARITPEDVEILTRQVQNEIMQRRQERTDELAAENRAAGEAFLAENAERPEVAVLPSGLQYEVLREADGPRPAPDDTVKVHYVGTLVDGSVFDSSYDRGQPAVLRPDRVIPGWTEALPMMPVGAKWKLYVPDELAFGRAGMGTNVPPGATLVYEIELLSIEAGGTSEEPEAGGR